MLVATRRPSAKLDQAGNPGVAPAPSDGAPAGQRRVFLTELIDPLGHAVHLTWDAPLRLVAITDAIGQVSTMQYGHPSDPLKITRVTDPFGRSATLTYNAAGQLASITDVLGLRSSFTYGPNDFLQVLSTPYGQTSFRHEAGDGTVDRFIEATDPLGGTEHLEFQWETPALAPTAPAGEVPAGFAAWNTNLDHWNTFYWDKRAWALAPGNLSQSTITHWLVAAAIPSATWFSSPVAHSVKRPLEDRVWYAYPGQTTGQEHAVGWWREPSRVGRVLEDGTSQITETAYTERGQVLTRTDPWGGRRPTVTRPTV